MELRRKGAPEKHKREPAYFDRDKSWCTADTFILLAAMPDHRHLIKGKVEIQLFIIFNLSLNHLIVIRKKYMPQQS